ncbi:MAG: hypothetical protein Q7S48_03255 [bacterium]|nr:hypothetical protein [bacterium]
MSTSSGGFDNGMVTIGDYVLILIRRWWLIAVVTIMSLSLGWVTFQRRSTPPFPHMAVLELGTVAGATVNTEGSPLSTVEDVYIPTALAEYAREKGYTEERFTINARLSGNLILLEAFGAETATEDLFVIEKRVAELLVANHAGELEVQLAELRDEKLRAEGLLEDLKEQMQFLRKKYTLIDDTSELLNRQIRQTEERLREIERNRVAVLTAESNRSPDNESLATALLLIDNDIQKNQERLYALEERLTVQMKSDRDTIDKTLQDNKREQRLQEHRIINIQLKIDHVIPTHLAIPPTRLLRPASRGINSTLLLSGTVGMLLGMLVAFLFDFAVVAWTTRRVR